MAGVDAGAFLFLPIAPYQIHPGSIVSISQFSAYIDTAVQYSSRAAVHTCVASTAVKVLPFFLCTATIQCGNRAGALLPDTAYTNCTLGIAMQCITITYGRTRAIWYVRTGEFEKPYSSTTGIGVVNI